MASSNGKTLEESDRVVAAPEQQRSQPKRMSRVRWTVGLLVRLCIWYFLLTPFFRCPSRVSDLTESSPRICKPYLAAKSYVQPHVVPYYNTYGAPYVDSARPYVRVLNEKVYTPASNIAKQGYERYGAPALDRAQAYGQQQWDANIVPHIQTAKAKASGWYGAQVAPHVERITVTISPYYKNVHRAYWATLDGYVLPFCAKYRPFIGKTYTSGQEILTTTVMPYAQSAWSSTIYLVNSSLWPKVSSLYSENVEPQLVKIGQRLASYREGKRLGKVTDEVESSAGYSSPSPSTSVEASKPELLTTSSVSAIVHTPSLSPSELAAQTREKIASDLITWKTRFASASEKGVEDLEGRVVEIVESYLASGAQSNGNQFVTVLGSAVNDKIDDIKRHISTLTESLPFEDAPEKEEAAIDDLLKEVRNSAMSIRDRAHALREWHISFEQGLNQRVLIAVNSTLAVLDDVRDLGLREIGMRWAWMDGVTYKDWEDYHALKAEFEDWKSEFRQISLQHARIEAAKDIADNILSRGMEVAEAAAKELARLKDVGRWKIAAREVSEDFETRSEPPPPLPKPDNITDEDIPPMSDGDHQVPLGSEETAHEVISSMHAADDSSTETTIGLNDEALKLDERLVTPADDADSSEFSSEFTVSSSEGSVADSQVDPEAAKVKDETEFDLNKAPFGAAAAKVVVPDEATVDNDDVDSLDNDEVVDAEATRHAEALLSLNIGSEVETGQADEKPNIPPTPSQAPTPDKAVQDLLSELLAGKDASFTEEILKKLNAIYETRQPSHASSSLPSEPVEDQLTFSSTQPISATNTPTPESVNSESQASQGQESPERPTDS